MTPAQEAEQVYWGNLSDSRVRPIYMKADGVIARIAAAISLARQQQREQISEWYVETFCGNSGCDCNTTMTEPCTHCQHDCKPCNIAHAIRTSAGGG